MGSAIDLTGQRFGRLSVVRQDGTKRGQLAWLCRCDCGNEVTVDSYKLRTGHTQSCDCLKREKAASHCKDMTRHGHCVDDKRTPTWRSWFCMMQRCYYANAINYGNYGGRGIRVCKHWHKFENFLTDMGERPEGMTLDRIDNDGDYEPDNCKWSDWFEQAANRRPPKRRAHYE